MWGSVRLPNETLWFVLVNVLDYFLTFLVLYYSEVSGSPLKTRLVESNPIAAYFIKRWGVIEGLLVFKLTLVAVVCLIAQRIALRQPQTARYVLNLGTAVTGVVVLYSVWLLNRAMS
jgi:hypothetical protein